MRLIVKTFFYISTVSCSISMQFVLFSTCKSLFTEWVNKQMQSRCEIMKQLNEQTFDLVSKQQYAGLSD